MSGALARWPAFRGRKADRGADRDPARVLADDVVAVDHVYRKDLIGPVADAGLKPRPRHAWTIGRSGLPERFDGELQHVGELPVPANAVKQIMPIDGAVPQPAGVEVDPHHLRQPIGRRHHRESGEVVAGQGIERPARIERQAEFSDPGRDQVGFGLGLKRRAPFAVAAEGVGEHAEFHRPPDIHHAGWVGDQREIRVGGRRYPAFQLAGARLGDVGGIYRIGAVGGARMVGHRHRRRGCDRRNCHAPCPAPHASKLADSAARHSSNFAYPEPMTDHDHHHHDHDHSELSDTELRVRALETILTEKGYVDPAALDLLIETYETKIGPRNGARVVAKAWSDPAYRARLLADATPAIAELGYAGRQGEHIVALENTRSLHNMVVCTLCSCYPWPVLGLPPVWYKSAPYRSKAVKDPRGVLKDFGFELPQGTEIQLG